METIETSKLKPHPRNNEFFDDIQSDNWIEFKKSIETSGVIEPIVISNTSVIVSGHQRVRACNELGVKDIPCRIKMYDTDNAEDVILKELLETNLRQRGIGNLNPIKLGKCFKELERIYGVRDGSAGAPRVDNLPEKKQDELAESFGISKAQVKAYKKLLSLIPELQDLIETGKMPATVGHKIWAKLPQEEQKKLIEELGADKIAEMTQKQTQEYIQQINKKEELIGGIKKDFSALQQQYQSKSNEVSELKQKIELLSKSSEDEEYQKKLKDSTIFFCARVNEFLEKVGGFAWLTNNINMLPDYEKKSFIAAIDAVLDWSEVMHNELNNIVNL